MSREQKAEQFKEYIEDRVINLGEVSKDSERVIREWLDLLVSGNEQETDKKLAELPKLEELPRGALSVLSSIFKEAVHFVFGLAGQRFH